MNINNKAISFMGADMHPLTMSQTINLIDERISGERLTVNNGLNVAKIIQTQDDPKLKEYINSSDIISIEGTGLVWGARLLGYGVPERVAGIDLFAQLLDLAEKRGYSVFFLGAKPEVIAMALKNIKLSHPQLIIAGYHHGYFWEREREIVNLIKKSHANMLFVGITSPYQERFIHNWKNELGVLFAMGIGGSLDVVSGKTKRAPLWIQKIGMEWLFRLLQEPRRLGRRYFYTNGAYVFYLFKEMINRILRKVTD